MICYTQTGWTLSYGYINGIIQYKSFRESSQVISFSPQLWYATTPHPSAHSGNIALIWKLNTFFCRYSVRKTKVPLSDLMCTQAWENTGGWLIRSSKVSSVLHHFTACGDSLLVLLLENITVLNNRPSLFRVRPADWRSKILLFNLFILYVINVMAFLQMMLIFLCSPIFRLTV